MEEGGLKGYVERNVKIQDIVKFQDVLLESLQAENQSLKQRLEDSLQAKLQLLNLQDENQLLRQRLEDSSELMPEDVEIEDSDNAIALSTTTLPQVEASEPGEVTDKPPCPSCGEAVRIRNNGIRKNKDGIPISQRWLCNNCKKGWSVAIAPSANN